MANEEVSRGSARVALLSLENWDDIWRRNQHLVSKLAGDGLIGSIDFLEPPRLRLRTPSPGAPLDNVRAVPLSLRFPKRAGGLAELGRRLRLTTLRQADVLWVNDPTLGVHCLRSGQPVVYDVTDDWRAYDFPSRIVRRIVQAEDILARRARTVVCSAELRDRWRERYGVEAVIVHNGVNSDAWHTATPRVFEGRPPHVGYVGTLQPQRLDIDLMLRIADHEQVGTLHLIGPDALDENSRGRLSGHSKVNLHRPIPADEVPAWTKGLDLLVCPHRITPFTLSLDAIKSYEYLASGRPVLATPTSGFQLMVGHPGVHVVPAHNFTEAIAEALSGPSPAPRIDLDWSARAQEFAGVLLRDQAVAS